MIVFPILAQLKLWFWAWVLEN